MATSVVGRAGNALYPCHYTSHKGHTNTAITWRQKYNNPYKPSGSRPAEFASIGMHASDPPIDQACPAGTITVGACA